jgi:D-3-phosphoglycerate dehydrogenase
MAMKVLVTPRSLTETTHPAVEGMRRYGIEVVYSSAGKQPDEQELLQLVPGVAGWLAGVEPVSPQVIAAARQLRCISRNGTGVDNLPLELLKQRNITLRTAGGANAPGVAELTIGLMFSALRNIPNTDRGIKSGSWPRKRGMECRGRRVAVIGFGAVGREVARLAAALGANVLAHDPFYTGPRQTSHPLHWASLIECLSTSDILSLHCPSSADGRALLGVELLEQAKPGLIIINTARASLVDEEALEAALDSGRVSSYCVDVFEPEPPRLPGLAARPEVIATSHIGGYTEESVTRATEFAVANLLDTLGLKEHAH